MAQKAAKLAKAAERESILDYFAEFPDPRSDSQSKRRKLIDIITISILATICRAEHSLRWKYTPMRMRNFKDDTGIAKQYPLS